MKTEYFTKGEILKVETVASKGGAMRLKIEIPLIEETAMLAMNQNNSCAIRLNFDQATIDSAVGQLGLFEGHESEEEAEPEKEFFGV